MDHDYVNNYVKAIENPLPELKESFDAELSLLREYAKGGLVLDVGCGAGRPADLLVSFSKKVVCIDNDQKMIGLARQRLKNVNNTGVILADAKSIPFQDNYFDVVYGTYNLLGSVNLQDKKLIMSEMNRVTKKGGHIINMTWKKDKFTTDFLRKYYPSIGIDVVKIDTNQTITSKGTFERLSTETIINLYKESKLLNIKEVPLGPVWVAVIGERI